LLTHTETGVRRLRAGLPTDASLAHKTGTAPTDLGRTPAINDIGLVTLKDGRQFAIVAFLAGSTATEPERDRLIADTARLFTRALS
jgi:beta-lactamase class A